MVEVKVCVGTACHLKGSYNVVATFQAMIEEKAMHNQVDMKVAFCMGKCGQGICVAVDDDIYGVTPEGARAFFQETIVPRTK